MLENVAQLKTTRAKRVFAITASAVLIAETFALLFIYFREPRIAEPYYSLLTNVIGNLVASSIAAITVAAIFVYLLPAEASLQDVEVLDPARTTTLHKRALDLTDFWYHNGHIGRWARVTAIPALAKSAMTRGGITVKLIILDPANKRVCSLYADYRESIAFKEDTIRTLEDVQAELLATIIVGQLYEQKNNGMHVEIFLADRLNLVREDISSIAVFRTQVDPRCPALVYHNHNDLGRKSEYYNTAKSDFEFTSRCCKLLTTKSFPEPVTAESTRKYLRSNNLLPYDSLEFATNVYRRVQSQHHPYA
jgi:hypothetical protein